MIGSKDIKIESVERQTNKINRKTTDKNKKIEIVDEIIDLCVNKNDQIVGSLFTFKQ